MNYTVIQNGFIVLDEDDKLVVFTKDETGFTFECNPPHMTWSVVSMINGTKVLEENEEFNFAFNQAKATDFASGKVFTNKAIIDHIISNFPG